MRKKVSVWAICAVLFLPAGAHAAYNATNCQTAKNYVNYASTMRNYAFTNLDAGQGYIESTYAPSNYWLQNAWIYADNAKDDANAAGLWLTSAALTFIDHEGEDYSAWQLTNLNNAKSNLQSAYNWAVGARNTAQGRGWTLAYNKYVSAVVDLNTAINDVNTSIAYSGYCFNP